LSEKVEASQKTVKEQIIEALAILEHNQWSHWIKYQDRLFNDEEAGYDVWYRWRELAKTKYADLKEEQKESDREWARASFKIVSEGLVASLRLTNEEEFLLQEYGFEEQNNLTQDALTVKHEILEKIARKYLKVLSRIGVEAKQK